MSWAWVRRFSDPLPDVRIEIIAHTKGLMGIHLARFPNCPKERPGRAWVQSGGAPASVEAQVLRLSRVFRLAKAAVSVNGLGLSPTADPPSGLRPLPGSPHDTGVTLHVQITFGHPPGGNGTGGVHQPGNGEVSQRGGQRGPAERSPSSCLKPKALPPNGWLRREQGIDEVMQKSGWEASQRVHVFAQEKSPSNRPDVHWSVSARVSSFLIVMFTDFLVPSPVRPGLWVKDGVEGSAQLVVSQISWQEPSGQFSGNNLDTITRAVSATSVDWGP
jgi:hypothetical protein